MLMSQLNPRGPPRRLRRAPLSVVIGNAANVRLTYNDRRRSEALHQIEVRATDPAMSAVITRHTTARSASATRLIGGDAQILVQVDDQHRHHRRDATAKQVAELARAGSEIVRITVNTAKPRAGAAYTRAPRRMGCDVPLVGDFHFNGHKLLTEHPECARVLAKYRINPGNVGRGAKRDEQFATMIGSPRHENR